MTEFIVNGEINGKKNLYTFGRFFIHKTFKRVKKYCILEVQVTI